MPRDFQSQPFLLGTEGLDLQTVLDKVGANSAVRMTNLLWKELGSITVRPGLTLLSQVAALLEVHTIARLNDSAGAAALGFPDDGLTPRGFRFIAGADKLALLNGATGTVIDTGWSGFPLTTLPYRPTLSASPWLYIADTVKMRKVRPTSTTAALVLQLGLPRPTNPDSLLEHDELPLLIGYRGGSAFVLATRDLVRMACGLEFDLSSDATSFLFSLDTTRKTVIDNFDATAGWTVNAGTGGGVPVLTQDLVDKKEGVASMKITTVAAATGYYSFINKAAVLDLSKAGPYPADDHDQIHLWAKLDRPDYVDEIRLYFILSNYSASAIPGASAGVNDNAFVLVFRPNDYQSFLDMGATQLGAQSSSNTNTQTQQQGGGGQNTVPQVIGGKGVWTEFGTVGLPVLRGSPTDMQNRSFAGFRRVGSDTTLGWKDVIGLSIVIKTNAAQVVNLWIDDLFLRGGAGPDSSFPGNIKYNYRYRHFDPRTGASSNPCDVSPDALWVDSVRTAIRVHPAAFGDSAIRQQFFRQGGALVQNWYYVGQNEIDGGEFVDDKSDNALLNAELLEFDHDQPVTTVDAAGNTLYAVPLHTIFGPVSDLVFGLGDPNRKGNIYWCKTGEPDHWPVFNTRELCGSADELTAGCVWEKQPFAFSRLEGYALIPNIVNAGTVDYVPLGMKRGPLDRHCLAVTPEGIAFVAADGIFITSGGPEKSLTDEKLYRLFHGESVEGYPAIEPAALAEGFLQLRYHAGELRLLYQTSADKNTYEFVFSMVEGRRYWRFQRYHVARQVRTFYSEPTDQKDLLVGAKDAGKLWQSGGVTDEGKAIVWTYRSGSLNQGEQRRLKEYGDVWVELDRQGATITAQLYAENESIALAPLSINTGAGKRGYILDPFALGGSQFQGDAGTYTASNLTLELSGLSNTTPPILYQAVISYLLQPESSQARVLSEQDEQGRLTDKYVKGILIECDTGGLDKTIAIQGDGVTQASIVVNAAGRRSVMFAWPEFRARLLRGIPDSVEWVLWGYRWIFDEEPAALTRWETQPLNYGASGWHYIPYAWITIACIADVEVTITYYGQNGQPTGTVTRTITSTGGVKQTVFVGFAAGKGVLSKWLLTCHSAFWLYRPETSVFVQPWPGGDGAEVKPFGDDDLDGVRGLHDAGLGASRGGGAE